MKATVVVSLKLLFSRRKKNCREKLGRGREEGLYLISSRSILRRAKGERLFSVNSCKLY